MIQKFIIKKENGEDVLYVTFQFDYEFADMHHPHMKTNLLEAVKEFFLHSGLEFHGSKIILKAKEMTIGIIELDDLDIHLLKNQTLSPIAEQMMNQKTTFQKHYLQED